MVHAYNDGLDVIPPQRPNGAGLDVFAGRALQQAGFYTLAAPGNDSIQIALNEDRKESQLELWDLNTLQKQWKGDNIFWAETNAAADTVIKSNSSNFPLWKVCVILALIMLAAETYLLAANYRKTSIAAA